MKANKTYRKTKLQKELIHHLEKNNPRFRRVFHEFEEITHEIWEIEMGNRAAVPDDFMWALDQQKKCLEEEIDQWLYSKDV